MSKFEFNPNPNGLCQLGPMCRGTHTSVSQRGRERTPAKSRRRRALRPSPWHLSVPLDEANPTHPLSRPKTPNRVCARRSELRWLLASSPRARVADGERDGGTRRTARTAANRPNHLHLHSIGVTVRLSDQIPWPVRPWSGLAAMRTPAASQIYGLGYIVKISNFLLKYMGQNRM